MSYLSMIVGPSGLIFVGATLATIGAFWAASEQARFERELREKSDEIAEISRRALNSVTGGDSICYFHLALSPKGNSGKLILIQKGEFPLYDVGARIVDLDKFEQIKDNLSLETIHYADTLIDLGNLSPNTGQILRDWNAGTGVLKRYNIFFDARNGFFVQLLRLALVDQEWVSAIQVKRGDKVMLEEVHPKFPRNSVGEVEWEDRAPHNQPLQTDEPQPSPSR